MSLQFEEIFIPGYEKVVKVTDPSINLTGIIAIHSTALGPTLGGTRIYPYKNFQDALFDVLRLSKGMTYKTSMADVGLGGGKSVIICDPADKTPALLRKWGEAVDKFNGLYIAAEDMGCSTEDVAFISESTKYVAGLSHPYSSGNPSPFTAFGVLKGIQAVCQYLFNDNSIKGKKVAVQGLGSVGKDLLERLFWEGADLIVADIDQDRTNEYAKKFGAKVSSPEGILFEECDILVPCALGGILSQESIPKLRCKAVAGAANNQLLEEKDADRLFERRILYAPDFVINAGGLNNVASEISPEGYNPSLSRTMAENIYGKILGILRISEKNLCSTHSTALSLAEYRIKYKIGKRQIEPFFHHAVVNK